MGNLVFKNPANQALAADAGGVEAVVAAMKAQPKSAAVAERGAAALGNLGAKNTLNQARVGAAGGIETIVDSLARFQDHAGVQEQGFRALRNLSALDDATITAAEEAKEQGKAAAAGVGAQAAAAAGRFGMSAIPAALRAYVAKLRAEHERGCAPLSHMLKSLDVAFGTADSAVLTEVEALRARVKNAVETIDSASRAEF